ncbi:response regulator [bacterium]|nr:response regulator [bacterium]
MNDRIILVIEDNEHDEELTLISLNRLNLNRAIVVLRDGAEALDYLDTMNGGNGKLPCVILLDIKLPKVDGLEVLRAVRANARTRYVPVVMLTSSTLGSDISRAYEYGANSFVRKPIEFREYDEAVGRIGLFWSRLNRYSEN